MHTSRRIVLTLAAAASAFIASAAPEGAKPSAAPTARTGEPYTLDVCAASDSHRLGSKGDPVVRIHEGRELRFCSAACGDAFTEKPAARLEKVDELIVAQQMPFYPLTNCVVNPGDELEIEGAHDVSVRYVHFNRLVRFCCEGCVAKFQDSPAKFLAVLDAAVIDAQSKDYPLTTCVISGEQLGTMGHAVDKVYSSRLVRFCCEPCVEEFEKDPAKYFRQIDAARKP